MTLSMERHDPAELGMSATRLADAAALMDRQYAAGLTPMAVPSSPGTASSCGRTPSAMRGQAVRR
jgi:hypothetical protein